ncbi:MAG TPA: hypothetical protein VHM94_13585 [Acidimicrobiia bacterium]|nr:hypothetical protein [Acidimicrobiia bacterium]
MTADNPEPEGGERLWPGFVVVAFLAVALAAAVISDRDDPPISAASTTVPSSVTFGTDPTLLPATTSAATTAVSSTTTTQSPTATTEAPSTAVAPTTTTVAVSPITAAREALTAWGRFAVSGDLDRLEGFLHPDGPQFEQLAAEAGTLADEPLGPPPYTVMLVGPRIVERGPSGAVVRGGVKFARQGEPIQRYRWDLVMVPGEDGDWLLWTVVDRG